MATTAATVTVTPSVCSIRWSTSMTLPKQSTARTAPQISAVRISFHSTRPRSPKSSSFREIARITVTEDCDPELPPVSISIGINAVRQTTAFS